MTKKAYICTPLSDDKFKLELIQRVLLKKKLFAFIPPPGQLKDKLLGAEIDKMMIDLCDEVLVFGKIGRDCSWEIGYATGLGKKVTIIRDDSNEEVIINDWMTVINIFVEDASEYLKSSA